MATYRINFNANSGSGAPAAVSGSTTPQVTPEGGTYYYASVRLPSNRPSRTYYNFLGWSSSSGASSAAYSAGGTYTVNTTNATFVTTLYAVWQHQTAYVYYNANGGSGAPSTQSHWAGYSVTLSATIPTRTGYNFLGWATSASATTAQYQPNTDYQIYTTVTLYAVWQPAASKLSTSNGTLGTAQTINITRYVNTYTDTITYSFGSATGTIATKTNAGSVSWTPPTSLASQIPNASTGTCTLTCTTYNGNAVVGTSSITITLSVPQSLAPTVSVSYADTIAKCLEWGLFVQSRSRLAFTISASGQQGASIASYSASVNGSTYTSASFTTGVLLNNGSNSYSITVTDSRGLKTVSTGNFTVIAYSNPSLTLTLCDRNDSDSEQIDIGFDFAVSSVSNNNEAKYRIDYKLKSASTWTNGTVQNLGAYSGSISDSIANLDGGDEWDIRINVIDSFQTSSVESEVGVSGNILLNSRHNGGLGILMKSQADDQCDIGKKTVFHETVDVIPRRAYATLSSSGWYRICTAQDESGAVFDFTIGRKYGNVRSEAHKITMLMVGGGQSVFTDESSATNVLCIDKIRCTYGDSLVHFDIHFNASSSEEVYVDYVVSCNPNVKSTCESEELTSVNDAPSGETILLTYSFATQLATPLEYGITGSWRYRKWSDGRIEIWGVPRVTMTLVTVGAYHRGSFTFDLPFTLSDLEMLQMTAYKDTLWYCLGNFTNGKTVTGYGYDVVDSSNYSTYVSVYAIGKL